MITYDTQDPPEEITIPTSPGAVQVLAWQTRVPGLLAIRQAIRCGDAPESWSDGCYGVYSPGLGEVIALCFPMAICAAACASLLDESAPWSATPQDIRSALTEADRPSLWAAGSDLGGQPHQWRMQIPNYVKETAHV